MSEIYDYNVIKNQFEENGYAYYDTYYKKLILTISNSYVGYNLANRFNSATNVTDYYLVCYAEPVQGMYKFGKFPTGARTVSDKAGDKSLHEILFPNFHNRVIGGIHMKLPVKLTFFEHRDEPICDIYAIG